MIFASLERLLVDPSCSVNPLRHDVIRITLALSVLVGLVLMLPGRAVAENPSDDRQASECRGSVEVCGDAAEVRIQPYLLSANNGGSSLHLLRLMPACLLARVPVAPLRSTLIDCAPAPTSLPPVNVRVHSPACPMGP